ncbi:DUF3800 domain-containing protein [Winogradskyella sp. 3972H.M.0a.05]|uniref:DUF3800 domain-containing protein n=1 Tax=Winogradskyella sp. 3972H.M.0a.05 TaxID=2950277 RepID=UPI0033910977
MRYEFNTYCDESCHLENDDQKSMVLGAIWANKGLTSDINKRIRSIKKKHGLKWKENEKGRSFEIKWNKVSKSKEEFYLDLLDYFFDDDDLHFRAIVIPDKNILDHEAHFQSHDDFYYKMFFLLIRNILSPENAYNIYIDIKDTKSQDKVNKLEKILRTSQYDFNKKIIKKVQQIRSHESEILQITDLLIGALSYLHRGIDSNNSAKKNLIEKIRERSGYSLLNNTLPNERKLNVLVWKSNFQKH